MLNFFYKLLSKYINVKIIIIFFNSNHLTILTCFSCLFPFLPSLSSKKHKHMLSFYPTYVPKFPVQPYGLQTLICLLSVRIYITPLLITVWILLFHPSNTWCLVYVDIKFLSSVLLLLLLCHAWTSCLILILSNVRLTLPRGIPPVDTVDVAKNNNFLSQRGKIYFCRIPKACLSSPFPLSHPESLTPILSVRLSHSHSLTPTLSLPHSLCSLSRSLVHWRYLSLSLCPLSGSLDLPTSLCSSSLRSQGLWSLCLCVLRLSKRLVFLFRLCWKSV